jgi:lipocalin
MACLFMSGCAGGDTREELSVVASVDLARYAGTWYEIARLAGPSHDGNYWILYLDDEYRTALVGTPDRQYLWILSRSPQMEHVTFERLVEKGRDLGYPMDKLIRDRRAAS